MSRETLPGGEYGRCPLTLFTKINRRIAISRRSNGVNQPRFNCRTATAHYHMFATTIRQSCQLLQHYAPDRYTDADPLKILWVDPTSIERISEGPTREYGSVDGGDWDDNASAIVDDRCYRSMRQHFNEGVSWEDTPLFRWLDKRIQSGDPTAWTHEQYLARLESIDTLYEQIARGGYLSQRELFETVPSETLRANNDCIHPYINEVGVDIGPEGRLLWRSGGRHRLFIAKLLGISRIPVKVKSRHKKWQEVRDSEYTKKDHPDLDDLSNK